MNFATQNDDPHTTTTAIRFRNAGKRFGSQTVLKDIDFDVAHHEFVSLVGPSGCGKSTLLRLIAGLESIDGGSLELECFPVTQKQAKKNDLAIPGYRNGLPDQIAFVFQEANLLPWLSAFDNVALPFRITGRRVNFSAVESTLETVGISGDDFNKLPKQLSGGMKMRVSIARALVLKPRVLLLDEPFAALDDMLRTQLNLELIRIWRRDQLSIVFVTHNISEAIFMSQRVAIMQANPGRIKSMVEVPFPYPREKKLKSSSVFAECFAKVSAALEVAE